MFDVPTAVKEREQALRAVQIPIRTVLRCAGVDRSTWTLWKSGKVSPRLVTWQRVDAEITKALRSPDVYRINRPEEAA